MTDVLTTFLLILLLLVVLGVVFLLVMRQFKRKSASEITVHISLQQIRSIGQLSVFKIITKEIVTETDHSWGAFGSKYLSWVLSKKKMAMIFEFEIDFRYDLRRSDFVINETGPGAYRLHMPPCLNEVHIRDIQFYDEQRSRLLPWLLPDLLSGFLMDGFSEEHRNKLIAAAKTHAQQQATDLIGNYASDVESSARATLRSIGRAFGAEEIDFVFAKREAIDLTIAYAKEKVS